MTAGGRRRGRRRRGWGETDLFIPPGPPPEGIDLVIGKMQADREIVRNPAEERAVERASRSDLANLADDLAELSTPERDHRGRVVVDRTSALIGAVVVALVAAGLAYLVVALLSAPPPS
jgi:hypothetical protein